MLLLSSILGPAKPPVATREEVNSAPGVFIINGTRDSLIAEASNGDQVQIPPGERCLVCLSDYEPKEEVRQLTNCRHLFHRDCIDQVCPDLNFTPESKRC
jgi:RING-like zinc finger